MAGPLGYGRRRILNMIIMSSDEDAEERTARATSFAARATEASIG